MARVNLNSTQAVPEEPLAEGDYMLRCVGCDGAYKSQQSGKTSIKFRFSATDHPTSPPMNFFLGLPQEDDDERSINQKFNRINEMHDIFDIHFDDTGFDDDDYEGKDRMALVEYCDPDNSIDDYVKSQTRPFNSIRKFYKT